MFVETWWKNELAMVQFKADAILVHCCRRFKDWRVSRLIILSCSWTWWSLKAFLGRFWKRPWLVSDNGEQLRWNGQFGACSSHRAYRFPIEENRGVARENHDFLSSCSFIAFQAFLKRLKKSMLLVLFTASGCVFITYCWLFVYHYIYIARTSQSRKRTVKVKKPPTKAPGDDIEIYKCVYQ